MEMINKLSKYNVLVVDDDEELCVIMKFYLSKIKTIRSIVTVHDGMSASQRLRNQKFDLILLDMKLPRLNGYELFSEFRGNPFNTIGTVVAMSGTMDREILTTSTQYGVKLFLIKPFDEKLFLEKIGAVISLVEEK